MMQARIAIPMTLTTLSALAAGVLSAALLAPMPTPAGLEPAVAADTATAGRQSFADERTVDISFETSPEQSLTTHASGTVSEDLCSPGRQMDSGSRLLSVNGSPVITLHTGTPLYRQLGEGDAGPDVLALQQELMRLGYASEGNGAYGRLTAAGVSQLLANAGVAKPDGRIRPENTVWISQTSITPTQCTAGLNATLSDGGEVMKTGGQLTAATFPVPSGLSAGKRTLTLFGASIALDKIEGRVGDQTFLNKIQSSDGYKAAIADQGGKKPTASLALDQPINAIKVPPSAITGQSGDKACVSADGKHATPVTIIGSGLGATLIQPDNAKATISTIKLGHSLDRLQCPIDGARK
ncbi:MULTISPECIES: peptidoglycan-binding domain-containing protein [Bifidobacterium]|jgi:peptidoglycan hydrolase-like protein with peptidoglycan-binding domain|nr:peptidoglycan-binding protein [Bifidobacterium tibiigranuli]MCI1211072.1 peptidoglycan-binding protein [Bifidobacterium tibiigranuli]MCI1220418.1 peptidoglycan-binding protein [Bifidobacterium tibiigranuli]MCI1231899.1 peptidoglycan-binding protein [Bifidobacterium tibiigranuli]